MDLNNRLFKVITTGFL